MTNEALKFTVRARTIKQAVQVWWNILRESFASENQASDHTASAESLFAIACNRVAADCRMEAGEVLAGQVIRLGPARHGSAVRQVRFIADKQSSS